MGRRVSFALDGLLGKGSAIAVSDTRRSAEWLFLLIGGR
jgi:hypothetical protein